MNKSPLATIKERFGDDPKKAKAKLVEAVKKAAGKNLWLEDRLNENKGLENVSSRKLLHLEQVCEAIANDGGSRDNLISEITKLRGREKDEDYTARLAQTTTPALWDQLQAARSGGGKKKSSRKSRKKKKK